MVNPCGRGNAVLSVCQEQGAADVFDRSAGRGASPGVRSVPRSGRTASTTIPSRNIWTWSSGVCGTRWPLKAWRTSWRSRAAFCESARKSSPVTFTVFRNATRRPWTPIGVCMCPAIRGCLLASPGCQLRATTNSAQEWKKLHNDRLACSDDYRGRPFWAIL